MPTMDQVAWANVNVHAEGETKPFPRGALLPDAEDPEEASERSLLRIIGAIRTVEVVYTPDELAEQAKVRAETAAAAVTAHDVDPAKPMESQVTGEGEQHPPTLEDVARLIPTRTRDVRNVGTDEMLGTFTADTTPDDSQAQAMIDAAVRHVLAQTGQLPSTTALDAETNSQCRDAAAWRAAADIEYGYPNRDADVHVADQLDARAKLEMTVLLRRLAGQGEGLAESAPFWSAPDPPVYADRDPGDYTRPYGLVYWSGVDRSVL